MGRFPQEIAGQHRCYAEALRAHLGSLATGDGIGTILGRSNVPCVVKGGVTKGTNVAGLRRLEVDNPYSPPTVDSPLAIDPAATRLISVARAFRWLGWLVTIVYIPIVIGSVIALVLSFLGRNDQSPVFMIWVCIINGAVLALGVSLIRTARRVAARDHKIRTTAMTLSCILMLGFPLFTIVGVICFRHIRKYLVQAPHSMK